MSGLRISAIIPAYNRAELIGETLRTILSQSRPPHEVIVVDDGSTDGTPDVVAGFGKDVVLIRQANAGAGSARNTGFARSSGEIVHFMDSDDLCSLNFYERAGAAIEAGADITYGPWLKTRFDGTLLKADPVVVQQRPVPEALSLEKLTVVNDWGIMFQPCLLRRRLIERAGPYRTDLKPTEDGEMLYRVMASAIAPRHVADTLVLYRIHPENQVSEQNAIARQIDWANFYTILRAHVAARSDMSDAELRHFRRKRLDVASDVRPYHEVRASQLGDDEDAIDRILRPLRHSTLRLWRRACVKLTGNLYFSPFEAAPLTDQQIIEIRRLGYELA